MRALLEPIAPTICVGLLLFLSTAAHSRGPPEPGGLRLGPTRLRPYMETDLHWVSNPGRLPSGGRDDIMTVARPGLLLQLGSDTLDLACDGNLEYRKFWGIEGKNGKYDNTSTARLSTWAADAAARLDIFPQAAYSLRLTQRFLRTAEPGYQAETRAVPHNNSSTVVALQAKPGGGALTITAGYGRHDDTYDRGRRGQLDIDPSAYNNRRHVPELKIAWNFLPKTALFIEGQAQITRFSQNRISPIAPPATNVNPVTIQVGATGAVTQRLSTRLSAGYGNTFAARKAAAYDSMVGQAEVTYALGEAIETKAGAQYTILPTSMFGYFAMWRGYLDYNRTLNDRLKLTAGIEVRRLDFGESRDPITQAYIANRLDVSALANILVRYHLTPHYSLTLRNSLDVRWSNYATVIGRAGYRFNDISLGVQATY